MKRFWIGMVLLAVLLVLGAWMGGRMTDATLPCADGLDRAAELAMAEDWPGAKQAMEQAWRAWAENRNFSASLSSHEPMEEIDALFEELEIYGAREETAAFSAGCVFLAEKLRDLGNSFRLSWQNLL